MSKANSIQVAGTHYSGSYQHWDLVARTQMGYLEGQVTKYVTRYNKKNGLEDLKKAQHFLMKCIEQQEKTTEEAVAFAKANKLSEEERLVVVAIATGRIHAAMVSLEGLIQNVEAKEPGSAYVDQG